MFETVTRGVCGFPATCFFGDGCNSIRSPGSCDAVFGEVTLDEPIDLSQ